jgi:hypothetical protein
VPRPWKAKDHDRHDQRVVGAEQALEHDEQTNGDEIGAGDVQDGSFDRSSSGICLDPSHIQP